MHYLQYHNTQENKGVNWEGTKAGQGRGGSKDHPCRFCKNRFTPPRRKLLDVKHA